MTARVARRECVGEVARARSGQWERRSAVRRRSPTPGVPQIVSSTSIPRRSAFRTNSSTSLRRYSGANGSEGCRGFCGAATDQLTIDAHDGRALAARAVEVRDPLRLPAERLVVEEADVQARRGAHRNGRPRHERVRPQEQDRGSGEHDREEDEPLQGGSGSIAPTLQRRPASDNPGLSPAFVRSTLRR